MEDAEKVKLLIKWLNVLQRGRTKPDTKGNSGIVRDAKDYIGYINGINETLGKILNVTEKDKHE